MKRDDVLTRIGERFGNEVATLVRTVRAYAVTVEKTDDKFAYVSLFDSDKTYPVPLCIIEQGMLRVKPKVGSLAVVTFMNGNENTPLFVAVAEAEEHLLKVGDTTLRIVDGLVEFNGGKLDGLVTINALTEKLNALVNTFNSHTHIVNTTGSAAAQTGTAQAVVSQAQRFNANDYKNNKIKQ